MQARARSTRNHLTRKHLTLLPKLAIPLVAVLLAAVPVAAQPPSFLTFESGQVRPLALSPNGNRLFAVNTPDNRLKVFNVSGNSLLPIASVPVGMEPVAVAARTNNEVWVVNHLSDSVSIVSLASAEPRVVRTLLVGDEPRDIVFAGPGRNRAFITTAHRGQHRTDPSLAGVPGAGDPQLTRPGIGRADVWVFDAGNPGPGKGGTPLRIVELFGDTPRALAVSPDGATVFAAVFFSGNQTTVIPEQAVCDGFLPTDEPDACPGEFPGVPGGNPGPAVNHEGAPAPEVGLVVRFDETSEEWRDELGRDWSNAVRFDLPDLDVFALDAVTLDQVEAFPHVGTVIFNMSVNPVSGTLYVSNTEAHNEVRFEGPGEFGGSTVQGRVGDTRITVIKNGRVRPRHLNKHIDYRQRPAPARTRRHSLATPLDMAVSSDGKTLYVAAFGSSKIGVFKTAALENDTFDPTVTSADYIAVSGGGPSGLVLDDARRRLFVLTRFDNAVSVIDLRNRKEVRRARLYNPEPQAVVEGRPLLYDAVKTSSNGEASCASCHIFGDLDGLAWDLGDPDADVTENPLEIFLEADADLFTPPINGTGNSRDFHPMKGPMTTQTLRGMADRGAMHWRGDRATGFFGSDALDEDLSLRNFTLAFQSLVGRNARFSNVEMKKFSDFILEVVLPPNPIHNLDNSLTPAQQAGRDLLPQGGLDPVNTCDSCHNMGIGSASFNGQTQVFKIPHLRNLYQKIGMFGQPEIDFFNPGSNGHQGDQVRGTGFLHDGSVDTLFRFFQAVIFNHDGEIGFSNDQERSDMEQFMLAFDTGLAPIVGQQVTLTGTNAAAVADRVELLVERAGTPFVSPISSGTECDLIAKGVLGGESRGALWNPSTQRFETDRKSDQGLSVDEVLDLASQPGQELTLTCAPPGSGRRMGIDRDHDGLLDRDELDAGTDPADPTSPPLPDISVQPLTRNFGSVAQGTESAPRTVTLTNDGTRNLRVFAIKIRGADRSQFRLPAATDGCSRTTLAPQRKCRFQVLLAPDSTGLKRALAVVPSTDPDEGEIRVTLRGTGIPGG